MASLINPLRRLAHTVAAPTPSSASAALALIRSQPNHYVVAALAGRKYLLAPRDVLTVPRLNDVKVGDTLALDNILEIGSREYTLRGSPVLDPAHVSVNATVVEHTKGRMESKLKFKKRKGYKKIIQHKQTYTRLRIGNIDFPAELAPNSASSLSPSTPVAPLPSLSA